MTLTLRLFPPILVGSGAAIDLTSRVSGWRRSIRRMGGFWMGDFSIQGEVTELSQLFYDYLGGHFEEKFDGQTTWEGMCYEMDLTISSADADGQTKSVTRRRSFDLMYNSVSATYTNLAGRTKKLAAATNAASISRYGKRHYVLSIDGVDSDVATALRDTYLKENAYPWPRVTAIMNRGQEDGTAVLDVMACGYIFTANWRIATDGSGSKDDADDWIGEILANDCPFLQVGRLDTNTLQVKKANPQGLRAGDAIFDIVELGDANGDPWRFYVDTNRRVYYTEIAATPEYYFRNGKIFASAGSRYSLEPWVVRPGIFRDMTYPVRSTEVGAWLPDIRDFYVDEVQAGIGSGLVLKSDLLEESEILAAQIEYREQLRQMKQGKRRKPWTGIATAREWERMTPAQRRAARAAKKARKSGGG